MLFLQPWYSGWIVQKYKNKNCEFWKMMIILLTLFADKVSNGFICIRQSKKKSAAWSGEEMKKL